MKDGVAYLSPFLAHNLGLQLHLEAFLSAELPTEPSSSQDLEANDRMDSNSRASTSGSASMGGGHSPQQQVGVRKVKVAPLDNPARREGFGSVLQPGQIPVLSLLCLRNKPASG